MVAATDYRTSRQIVVNLPSTDLSEGKDRTVIAGLSEARERSSIYPMAEAKVTNIAGKREPIDLEQIYKQHFDELYRYAFSMLKDRDRAEDTVQSVFLDVGQHRQLGEVHTSVRAFLYKSVYFKCLNAFKRDRVQLKFTRTHGDRQAYFTADSLENEELRLTIERAIDALPPECRKVFELCKMQGLKYHEAAQQLMISPKTVENQMGKALKSLRQALLRYIIPFTTLIYFLP